MSIEATAISKFLSGREVVKNLSLNVQPGEIYGLIGPNGAGKTTAMRLLAGLLVPERGSVRICGHDVVAAAESARRCIGWVTASMGLYDRLTVFELLHYYGRLFGLSGQQLSQRIPQICARYRIEHLLKRRCGTLSTGERQRVALARATVHDPVVLILDEPTAGLDVLASRNVLQYIRDLRTEGRSILFSTHYMTEAELLCDRMGLLHRGQIRAEGAPATLKTTYAVQSLEEIFLAIEDQEGAREVTP